MSSWFRSMAEMFRRLPRVLSFAIAVASSHAQPAQPAQPAQAGPSASPTPQNLVAHKTISLVTKTPLGDAAVQIAPGTALTNFEVQGDRVKISQGPFSAIVDLAAVQPPAIDPPAPEPTAAPSPSHSPEQPPANAPEEPKASGPAASPVPAEAGVALPSWLLPAVCGALAAYAAFATLALRGARRKTVSPTPANVAASTPVVVLPSKTSAKPAVVADEGRAIACPHCGKNIPLEKVVKGRNRCPSCDANFVGE